MTDAAAVITQETDRVWTKIVQNRQKWKVIQGKPKQTKLSKRRRQHSHPDTTGITREKVEAYFRALFAYPVRIPEKIMEKAYKQGCSEEKTTNVRYN